MQVSEMQRARLLSAAVATVEELGYARASVAHITSRARISRRTFYDLFENREDCLLAVMEDAAGRVERELAVAGLTELPWRERVRAGLWTILCFFDREPELARVCVVQGTRGGQRVLERREELFGRLAAVLEEGRGAIARAAEVPPLTAEGLVGAAVAILHKRLLAREREPLSGLLGELMSLIVLPYLGPAAARRERALPAPGLVPVVSSRTRRAVRVSREDPLADIPMRLTYRTARVLEVVAEEPGVSNRLVAERAGVSDQGQVSKLLARLERLGLLHNTGAGHSRGERNAWRLTDRGVQVTQAIGGYAHDNGEVSS
ncbi:MAG TPA: TetR family transcriptional regulator [Solirubrobacteraceae bacterium]|nr:TetR family transcriptional regulator [Solirubrobacteraceae bacterium]